MNFAYVHLLLNHTPVFGVGFGLFLLALAAFRKSGELLKIGLVVLVLSALVAVPTYLSGESAEEVVENYPGVTENVIERHEDAAGVALAGAGLLGLIAIVGLFLARGEKAARGWLSVTTLVLALIVFGLMAWTADLGGKIRHTEIRGDAVISAPGGASETIREPRQETDEDEH